MHVLQGRHVAVSNGQFQLILDVIGVIKAFVAVVVGVSGEKNQGSILGVELEPFYDLQITHELVHDLGNKRFTVITSKAWVML